MDIKNLELEIGLLHEKVCTALGDSTRIMMLYLLAEKAMCVNEISEALDIPQPTASRHLKVLRERDLVNTERQGTNVVYSLADTRIIQALNLMRDLLTERLQAQAAITGSQSMIEQSNPKEKINIPVASKPSWETEGVSSATGSTSSATGSTSSATGSTSSATGSTGSATGSTSSPPALQAQPPALQAQPTPVRDWGQAAPRNLPKCHHLP